MTDYANTYIVFGEPADDARRTVAKLVLATAPNVALPLHLFGWVALVLDVDATSVILEYLSDNGPVQPAARVEYDATAGAGKPTATPFMFAAYVPPGSGNAGEGDLAVTVVGATGPSPVAGVALEVRYNSNANFHGGAA